MKYFHIISTNSGFVLIFPTKESLDGVIKHLEGLRELAFSEYLDPPYLYCTYADCVDPEIIQDMLDEIKEGKK